MNKIFNFLIVFLLVFSCCFVYADDVVLEIDETSISENVVLSDEELLSESVISDENSLIVENTDELEYLKSIDENLKYIIDFSHSIFLFAVFCVIYKTLYKLFSFVI